MKTLAENLTAYQQLEYDLFCASRAKILYWAEQKFGWKPKGPYQTLLVACADRPYHFPEDYPNKRYAGKLVNKFAWRIGRQSGKTESISMIALYLALCNPIKTPKDYVIGKHPSKITPNNPTGRIFETRILTRGALIIVASRDVSTVKLIFDRCYAYLHQNTVYRKAIEEGLIVFRRNPYEITFHAEGWLKPANIRFTGPGSKGQSVRGFTFDAKIYDEADYLPPAFYEAEKATSINAGKDAITILSSTPTGKHDYFYKACFTENVPIILADNTKKKISEIQVGEKVLNRFGQSSEVIEIMNRNYSAKLVRIKTILDDEIIEATYNHKFMCIRKMQHFCNICKTWIFDPKSKCILYENHIGFPKISPDYLIAEDLRVGDLLCIPKIYLSLSDKPAIKEFGDFLLVPITHHEAIKKPCKVYNLTVEGDHSYLVNGFGVANCTDASWGFKEFHFSSWENPNYDKHEDQDQQKALPASVYKREIFALWGETEYGVFDWTYFEKVFGHTYQKGVNYKCIRFNNNDINNIGIKNFARWLTDKFIKRNPLANYWFGADLGYSADPTELVVFEEFNGEMKLVLRLHMEHIEYAIQADIISLLDTFYMFKMLGMDKGNNGVSVSQILQEKRHGFNKYIQHQFDKRLLPIDFGSRLMTGKVNGKEILVPAKQAMTDMVILHAQANRLILPGLDYDSEIENQFRNHTYTMGPGGQIVYSKGAIYPDHVIDAIRTAFYAKAAYSFKNVKKGSRNPVSTFKANNW